MSDLVRGLVREFGLRGNSASVLHAIFALCDPKTGATDAPIGEISEVVEQIGHGSIHYGTVSRILKDMANKGVIEITRRGKMKTNLYKIKGWTKNEII